MASAGDENLQLSFPLPPNLFKVYTDENVKAGLTPKPPGAVSGVYSMFGSKFDTEEQILRPLESQGIPRLYPRSEKFDQLVEMKKLNHSIVINFLELMDILIESPSSEERLKKIEDINVLFINLHHLINEFRPHQARETLRVMLHRQKAQRIETAEKLGKHVEKARSLLKDCHGILANLKLDTDVSKELSSQFGRANIVNNEEEDSISAHQPRLETIMCNICDNL